MKPQKILSLASLFLLATNCRGSLSPMAVKNAALRQGAGFVFVCQEDQTILLARRSKYVSEPGTWTGLGGAVEPGESVREAAIREVQEEAGSMPRIDKELATLRYERNGFVFTTFVANLTKEEKQRWKPKRDHENDRIEWLHELPDNLHPGLEAALMDYLERTA
jgi:8-oxo-dGTP pyrophosphatase MutT (NUDIX family)